MGSTIVSLINMAMPTVLRTVQLTLDTASSAGGVVIDGNPDPALNGFFPLIQYPDKKLLLRKFKRATPTVSYLISTDGEVPIDKEYLQVNESILGNFKIGKAWLFTEEDYDLLFEARKLQGYTSQNASQAAEALLEEFLSVPAKLAQSAVNLHTVLTLITAVKGACVYTDPTTDVPLELSYTSQVPAGNLAATKTGNDRWSQAATADGTADLATHLNTYYANNQMFPDAVLMGSTAADRLRAQNSTKIKVARMKGVITDGGVIDATAIANLPRPTLEDVRMWIATELTSAAQNQGMAPEFIVSDASYYQRGSNGTRIKKRYIPEDYYIFASANYIERALVPTASNDYAGGLSTTTEVLSLEPPREKVAVAGRGIPLCPDPRKIAARNTENTAI